MNDDEGGNYSDSSMSYGPLPFIEVKEDGKLELNPLAIEFLDHLKGKVIVIGVVGLYRTGKSFLLNLLVNTFKTNIKRQNHCFPVGSTVNACTLGIWIYGDILQLEDGTFVVFLDTEGLGSTKRNTTTDSYIFILTLLLSSYLIYNSRGILDGNAIEELSFMLQLGHNLLQKQDFKEEEQREQKEKEQNNLFPSLLWVVRDFSLELKENGKKISSKQYLENALKPQEGNNGEIITRNQNKSIIKDFFRQRDCVTLVRPADDEEILKHLQQVSYQELRKEFKTAFDEMKNKIFRKAQAKTINGKYIYGNQLVQMAQAYIEAINEGKTPFISNAWSRIIESQCYEVTEAAFSIYKNEFTKKLNFYKEGSLTKNSLIETNEDKIDSSSSDIKLPLEESLLKEFHSLCKKIAFNLVLNSQVYKVDEMKTHLNNLKSSIKEEFKRIISLNQINSKKYCSDLITLLSIDLKTKEEITTFQQILDYLEYFNSLYSIYYKFARGPEKFKTFCEWNSQLIFTQIDYFRKNVFFVFNEEKKYLKEEIHSLEVTVAKAKGKAKITNELIQLERLKQENTLSQSQYKSNSELSIFQAQVTMKSKELEILSQHNKTLKELIKTMKLHNKLQLSEGRITPIRISGYLLKQENNLLGTKWKQKYFVLINDSLCYYQTKDQFDRGLCYRQSLHLQTAKIKKDKIKKNIFSLLFNSNEYSDIHLEATNNELRDLWIQHIEDAILNSKEKQQNSTEKQQNSKEKQQNSQN